VAGERKMSADDRILWGKVARTTRPLPGRMASIEEFETLIAQEQEKLPAGAPLTSATSTGEEPQKIKLQPQRHHPLERPVKKKIAKGRLALEARIDLHGLFQSEAHSLLLGFLIKAHERGLRHVLVITGKGSSMGSDGALKRAVPLWFSKPEFRYLISSYETAAQNHGGDGALYIRLARSRNEVS
jgi:DNA-nicking Smr family endonuclease